METIRKALDHAKAAEENFINSMQIYKDAKALVRRAIGAEYPLDSLIGKPFIYTKAMWGSPDTGVTDLDFLGRRAYMKPYAVEVGSYDNNLMGFEVGETYVHYVVLEHSSSFDDDEPEIWESLFIKIS